MSRVGRNDPCPCGSGKKYKKCCLGKDAETEQKQFLSATVIEEGEEYEADDFRAPEDEREDLDPWDADEEDGDGDEDEEDWEEDDWDEEQGGEDDVPERRSPEADYPLPDTSADEEALVEGWWDELMPFFKKRDADEMIRRIVDFMERHPDLFVHLGLDGECLFELGAELARRGQQSRYVELLLRIREEHPEVYVRSHAYYEIHVVTERILAGQQEAIPQYFNFFERYPDSNPDELSRLIDLLLAANCQDAVFDLARKTGVSSMRSRRVLSGDFVYQWFVFEKWMPFLDRGDASKDSCMELLEASGDIDGHLDLEFRLESITKAMSAMFRGLPIQDFRQVRKRTDVEDFYEALCWNFTRFLHERRGMAWATARFFANQLELYFREISSEKRPKNPFSFEQKRLDQYIARNCKRLLWLDGISSISLLQSVYEFAGYLEANTLLPAADPDAIRQDCRNLYDICKRVLEASDPGPRIFAEFPEYAWVS